MFFIFVNDFFNTMRSELHSERTIETYRQSLNAFRFYLSETYGKGVDQISLDFVTEQMVREFLMNVADVNSIGTRNVRLSGIKAYLKYVATRDMEVIPLQIAVSAIKAKRVFLLFVVLLLTLGLLKFGLQLFTCLFFFPCHRMPHLFPLYQGKKESPQPFHS